jgi:hypothetical protein
MKKEKTPKTRNRRALMEELEPRLLFSADLPGVLASAGLMDVEEHAAPPAITALVDAPSTGVIQSANDRTTGSTLSLARPTTSSSSTIS